jgi:hypothetical protein
VEGRAPAAESGRASATRVPKARATSSSAPSSPSADAPDKVPARPEEVPGRPAAVPGRPAAVPGRLAAGSGQEGSSMGKSGSQTQPPPPLPPSGSPSSATRNLPAGASSRPTPIDPSHGTTGREEGSQYSRRPARAPGALTYAEAEVRPNVGLLIVHQPAAVVPPPPPNPPPQTPAAKGHRPFALDAVIRDPCACALCYVGHRQDQGRRGGGAAGGYRRQDGSRSRIRRRRSYPPPAPSPAAANAAAAAVIRARTLYRCPYTHVLAAIPWPLRARIKTAHQDRASRPRIKGGPAHQARTSRPPVQTCT